MKVRATTHTGISATQSWLTPKKSDHLVSATLRQAEMFEQALLWMPLWGHIPCWTRQSSGLNRLSSMRIQNSRAAMVLWQCTRFCGDTTSRRHFLRLWLCWTFSLPLPWQRLRLSGVSQRWRESRCSCAMQWARNVWMHWPCSPWRGS